MADTKKKMAVGMPIELVNEMVNYIPLDSAAIQQVHKSHSWEALVRPKRAKWAELIGKRGQFIADFLRLIMDRSEFSTYPFNQSPADEATKMREAIEKLKEDIQKMRPLVERFFVLELAEFRARSGLENWFELSECEEINGPHFGRRDCRNIRHLLLGAAYTLKIPMTRPYRPDMVTHNAMLQLYDNQKLLQTFNPQGPSK